MDRTDLRVFDDGVVTLDQAEFCAVPGYLILRLTDGAESLAELAPATAAHLGAALARAAAAIERVVGADRVYVLSFCEVDRRLHFHLLPRTPALLAEYQRATGTEGEPANGPLLFEWARSIYPGGAPSPPGFPALGQACRELRAILASA